MHRHKKWLMSLFSMLGVMLFAVGASASDVDETINIDAVVGEEIYFEFYRDNGYSEEFPGFVAKRDGGNHPDWGDVISNSWEGNPRIAFIKTKAEKAGEWSFRAGVFETPAMSKQENRLYTVQVNLRIRAADNGSNPGSGNAGNSSGWKPGNTPGAIGTGYVLCESLSVRNEPNISSNPIANFTYGLTFDITQIDGDWCKVNLNGTSGWANFQYVLMNPQFITTSSETAAYAYAGPDAKRVALIDANTTLAVIADIEGYYVVSLRGASAFIKK